MAKSKKSKYQSQYDVVLKEFKKEGKVKIFTTRENLQEIKNLAC